MSLFQSAYRLIPRKPDQDEKHFLTLELADLLLNHSEFVTTLSLESDAPWMYVWP